MAEGGQEAHIIGYCKAEKPQNISLNTDGIQKTKCSKCSNVHVKLPCFHSICSNCTPLVDENYIECPTCSHHSRKRLPANQNKKEIIFPGNSKPHGIAVLHYGSIVVAEYGSRSITIIEIDEGKSTSIPFKQTNGQWNTHPQKVAIDTDGNILVTDDHYLYKYTRIKEVDYKFVRNQLKMNGPQGIAVQQDKSTCTYYVADVGNNCIRVFNNNVYQQKCIETGKVLRKPKDVAIDKEVVYIANCDGKVIQKILPLSTEVLIYPPSEFKFQPSSITINSKLQLVYVGDDTNKRVFIFNTDGKFLNYFECDNPPADITTDTSDYLYICYNNKIVVYCL